MFDIKRVNGLFLSEGNAVTNENMNFIFYLLIYMVFILRMPLRIYYSLLWNDEYKSWRHLAIIWKILTYFIVNEVLWHSHDSNSTGSIRDDLIYNGSRIVLLGILPHIVRVNEIFQGETGYTKCPLIPFNFTQVLQDHFTGTKNIPTAPVWG